MKKKLLSLGLACCLFLLSGCGSVGSVMKNIKAGNVDEANQLYLEKIAGNSEKEFDLEDALQTYIEGLYDDLNSGKVSSAEAQAFASTVYSMEMDSSSYTRKILSKLNDLIVSKQAYEDAMDAVAGEDYLTAYMLLQNVIEEDSNYETASSKMTEIVNDGMRSLNQEIDDAVAAKEFQKAIDLVDEAISLWGETDFLIDMRVSLPTQWRESNIADAEALRQQGRYAEALEIAAEAYNASGAMEIPPDVYEEFSKITDAWTEVIFAQAAEAFGSDRDYEAAIRVLQTCGLTDMRIDDEIARYQDYAPKKLMDMKYTRKGYGISITSTSNEVKDVNNHKYPEYETLVPYYSGYGNYTVEDSYVIYYLGGEYKSLSATLYRPYASLSASEDGWNYDTVARIYGDSVLLYEGPQITPGTYQEYDISIDVTGVRELKFVLFGCGAQKKNTSHFIPELGISNITIRK